MQNEIDINNSQVIFPKLKIKPYFLEKPLFFIVALASIVIWMFLIVSVIGILYALIIGIFFFIGHLGMIYHIRGSAVRLSSEQFPDLYTRVGHLSKTLGLKDVPEAYIMQAGGALNAFATKLSKSHFIVLFTDLIEACEHNEEALNMIIGHEIGHLKSKHLNGLWFLLPGMFVPFIGHAYSRCRELTCDRYGFAVCGNKQDALRGLTILAAGGKMGSQVNMEAFLKQTEGLNTGYMTFARWLSSYPSLSERVISLDENFKQYRSRRYVGRIRAMTALLCIFVLPYFVIPQIYPYLAKGIEKVNSKFSFVEAKDLFSPPKDTQAAQGQVEKDFAVLSGLVEEIRSRKGELPSDKNGSLSPEWRVHRIGQEEPKDPFDGQSYGYRVAGEQYIIYSVGPDGALGTEDDLEYSSQGNIKDH